MQKHGITAWYLGILAVIKDKHALRHAYIRSIGEERLRNKALRWDFLNRKKRGKFKEDVDLWSTGRQEGEKLPDIYKRIERNGDWDYRRYRCT